MPGEGAGVGVRVTRGEPGEHDPHAGPSLSHDGSVPPAPAGVNTAPCAGPSRGRTYDDPMTKVAVLGTGLMGAPKARNIATSGMQVHVWNRTREKAQPLAAHGAVVAGSPAEAVDGADVIVTMLSDGDAVLAAMTAAAPGLRPGQVWAQMSTVGVAATGRSSVARWTAPTSRPSRRRSWRTTSRPASPSATRRRTPG
ncbi:NAD(P)-binding domain-containing protein [Nonomuraea sp. B5E05]|uniref:NAD(P)-binding domain-containing protein n=1 Tax=Nonomuraea sp. B5E05 TaxID=3153569 RepID=UPI0032600583